MTIQVQPVVWRESYFGRVCLAKLMIQRML